MHLVLLGPPGSGKGTQTALLSQTYSLAIISTGDMLRTAVQSGSTLGQKVRSFMTKGELVPDDIMMQLLEQRLQEPDCSKGWILDGFPRTLDQAKHLQAGQVSIDIVIHFLLADEIIISRLTGRWIHLASGRTYHLVNNPPKQPGHDDVTGDLLVQREDDLETTVKRRLEVYHHQTKPVWLYYLSLQQQGMIQAIAFDADSDVHLLQQQLRMVIDNYLAHKN